MITVTASTSTTRPKKAGRMLTPLQLAELNRGPKANVLIGPDGDRFIGLEGASVSLLSHFSPFAKQKLVGERATTLCIPNGLKQPIAWIYKYMRAGETDAGDQETFETLAFDNLVLLYTHSAFLQYQHLMDRIVGRLKGKYYDALPSVDDLKTFSAFVPPIYDYAVGVLAHEMVNPWTCNYSSYTELAKQDQTFSDALGAAVQKLIRRRIKAGTEYYERSTSHQVVWSKQYYEKHGKSQAISTEHQKSKPGKSKSKPKPKQNVKLPVAPDSKPPTSSPANKKKRLAHKPKAGKSVKASTATESLQVPLSGEAKKDLKCYTCGKAGHCARDCVAGVQQEPTVPASTKKTKRPAPICYSCNEEGHLSRKCTAEKPEKSKRPAPICYNCDGEGHLARDCTAETKRDMEPKTKRPPPTCYNCDKEGHLAHDCSEARKEETDKHAAGGKATARDTTGRNRNFRHAQQDHAAFIDVAGNGEGLRTCDREVRHGEMTRTGLVV